MRTSLKCIDIARRFEAIGYRIYATRGTARVAAGSMVFMRSSINKIER